MRLAHEARRVAAQHEALDAFEREVRAAFEIGSASAIAASLRSLERALLAHFAIEEDVHFPALHGLDPGFAAEIQNLVREHVAFREALARLIADTAATGAGRVAAFAELADGLRKHENREEALFARSTIA
jgi:hypothetical protein